MQHDRQTGPDDVCRRVDEDHAGAAVTDREVASSSRTEMDDDDTAPIVARVWPTLDDVALQGAAGEIVRAVMPTTEADVAAVLVNVLAAVGVWLGPGPHLWVANSAHPPIIWPVLVGRTSIGAKGTATDLACQIVQRADPDFADHITSGLSSGEGLIELVRDESDDDPSAKDYDPGVEDKRALIVESEYAAVLSRSSRHGSTLGPVLRDAWDGKRLQVLNRKANRLTATAHHVGVIGHVTPGELVARLDDADLAGGSINRLLLILSQRSKMLPEGGNLTSRASDTVVALLKAAKANSKGGQYVRTAEAEDEWRRIYPSLLADKGEGREAQSTSRAVPQVLRLSLCYALLDGAPGTIGVDHLRGAVAVWRYAEASARYVFGDPAAPEQSEQAARLLAFITAAGDAGVTRTEISADHFKRHAKSIEIRAILRSLMERGRIDERKEETAGAPRCVYTVRRKRTGRNNPVDLGGQLAKGGRIKGETSGSTKGSTPLHSHVPQVSETTSPQVSEPNSPTSLNPHSPNGRHTPAPTLLTDVTEACPICGQRTTIPLVPSSAGLVCRKCEPGISRDTKCIDCGHPRDVTKDGRCNPCNGSRIKGSGAP